MKRIFIEEAGTWSLRPSSLVAAVLLHLLAIPVVWISFPSQPTIPIEAASVQVELVTWFETEPVPEIIEASPAPIEEQPTAESIEVPTPDQTGAAIARLPEVNLPPAPQTDGANREGLREALSNILCLTNEDGDGLEMNADCQRRRLAEGVAQIGSASEMIAERLARVRAMDLGFATDPNHVPPVADPARDPYAPNDFSWENPINDIRDPIPGVTHH